MAGITAQELKDELIGAFPPGVEEFVDWADVPGDVMQAFAETIASTAVDAAERLRQDVNPLTCSASKLADWENVLAIATTRTARSGTVTQRRRAVVSRLREYGPPSVPFIQSILGPLLDYADPSQLVILETSHAAQNLAHSYPWTGSVGFAYYSFASTILFFVRDDARVSASGAWVDLTITASNLSSLGLILNAPDGSFVDLIPKWTGSAAGTTLRAYFPKSAGAAAYGRWTLQVYTTSFADSGTVTAATLFVEGFGRDATGHDGGSWPKFEWAAVYEPTKSGGSPDFDAARAAARRITYGSRIGAVVLRSTGSTLPVGDFAFLPDDDNALPDVMIPG